MDLSVGVPFHEQLKCFGYFGFGSGVQLHLFGQPNDTGLYCNGCPKGATCWQRHRMRMRELFPDLTALADRIATTHRGNRYFKEFARQTGQSVEKMAEPYTVGMLGNMEDGVLIASDQAPKDRGDGSLRWPLVVLT